MTMKARVTLRGARTYTVRNVKYLKGIPTLVEGSIVKEFQNNGYFHTVVIREAAPEIKATPPRNKIEGQPKKKMKKKLLRQ